MAEYKNAKSRDSLTPGRAIRKTCIDCVGGASEVRDCQGDRLYEGPCIFYRYRMGKGRPSVKLIRKHCLWCMGGSPNLVKNCSSISTCPLHIYRMGRNPKRMHVSGHLFTRINEKAVGNGRIRCSGFEPGFPINPKYRKGLFTGEAQ